MLRTVWAGMIVSDGGCTTPGDVAKAFGGGADFVMLGGMLAGYEESGGRIVEENGEKFMLFYGMSSESAMKRHVGGVAEYRAAEGKTVKLPLRGPVENTARDILGGLRSACTYVGASRLKELTKRTTFIRVQEQENRIFNNLYSPNAGVEQHASVIPSHSSHRLNGKLADTLPPPAYQ